MCHVGKICGYHHMALEYTMEARILHNINLISTRTGFRIIWIQLYTLLSPISSSFKFSDIPKKIHGAILIFTHLIVEKYIFAQFYSHALFIIPILALSYPKQLATSRMIFNYMSLKSIQCKESLYGDIPIKLHSGPLLRQWDEGQGVCSMGRVFARWAGGCGWKDIKAVVSNFQFNYELRSIQFTVILKYRVVPKTTFLK